MIEIKSRVTYIYALLDGTKIKYIGKSNDPHKRFIYHTRYEKNSKSHKQYWVNKMKRNNKEISLKILEVVPYENWQKREIFWIAKYGLKNLVNHKIGGNGGEGQKSINFIKKDKNLKITSKTHDILLKYCKDNKLKIFDFVETIINENCK
jgi:hypothetical protein